MGWLGGRGRLPNGRSPNRSADICVEVNPDVLAIYLNRDVISFVSGAETSPFSTCDKVMSIKGKFLFAAAYGVPLSHASYPFVLWLLGGDAEK